MEDDYGMNFVRETTNDYKIFWGNKHILNMYVYNTSQWQS